MPKVLYADKRKASNISEYKTKGGFKMIAFILTMPNRGSWNGKWSGEREVHAIVKCERNVPNKDIIGKSFFYRWDDGWTACVSVEKVDSKEGNKIRKKSAGFCGYDWMVSSLIHKGIIEYDRG